MSPEKEVFEIMKNQLVLDQFQIGKVKCCKFAVLYVDGDGKLQASEHKNRESAESEAQMLIDEHADTDEWIDGVETIRIMRLDKSLVKAERKDKDSIFYYMQ